MGNVCGRGQCGLVGNEDSMWGGAVGIGWESGLYVKRGSEDWLGVMTVCGEGSEDCLGMGTVFEEGQWGLFGNRDCM